MDGEGHRLSRDNPKSRWHEEQVTPDYRSSWACVPLTDAVYEAEARSLSPAEGLRGCAPGECTHCDRDRAALTEAPQEESGLREARDLIATYLWNEDDSGDENDLLDAYDKMAAVLGASTEESVGRTLAASQESGSKP